MNPILIAYFGVWDIFRHHLCDDILQLVCTSHFETPIIFSMSSSLRSSAFYSHISLVTRLYLWPSFPWFQERAIGVFIGFTIFAGGYFVDRYLELEQEHPFQSTYKKDWPGRLLHVASSRSYFRPPGDSLGATVAIPIAPWHFSQV